MPHTLRVAELHVADPLSVQVLEAHIVAWRLDDHVVEAEAANGALPRLVRRHPTEIKKFKNIVLCVAINLVLDFFYDSIYCIWKSKEA